MILAYNYQHKGRKLEKDRNRDKRWTLSSLSPGHLFCSILAVATDSGALNISYFFWPQDILEIFLLDSDYNTDQRPVNPTSEAAKYWHYMEDGGVNSIPLRCWSLCGQCWDKMWSLPSLSPHPPGEARGAETDTLAEWKLFQQSITGCRGPGHSGAPNVSRKKYFFVGGKEKTSKKVQPKISSKKDLPWLLQRALRYVQPDLIFPRTDVPVTPFLILLWLACHRCGQDFYHTADQSQLANFQISLDLLTMTLLLIYLP